MMPAWSFRAANRSTSCTTATKTRSMRRPRTHQQQVRTETHAAAVCFLLADCRLQPPSWGSTAGGNQARASTQQLPERSVVCCCCLLPAGEEELEDAWEFDKRDYTRVQPPRQLDEPPPRVANDAVRALIRLINEATENIPCWEDHVPIMRRGPRPCDEVIAGSIYPHPKAQQPGRRKKKRSTRCRKDLWQRRQWHVVT